MANVVWQRFEAKGAGNRPYHYASVDGERVGSVVFHRTASEVFPRGAYAVGHRGRAIGWIGTVQAGKRMVEQCEQVHSEGAIYAPLTAQQREAAARVVESHYRLKRAVTAVEVEVEIANLRRRGPQRVDDSQLALAARLQVREGGFIRLWTDADYDR